VTCESGCSSKPAGDSCDRSVEDEVNGGRRHAKDAMHRVGGGPRNTAAAPPAVDRFREIRVSATDGRCWPHRDGWQFVSYRPFKDGGSAPKESIVNDRSGHSSSAGRLAETHVRCRAVRSQAKGCSQDWQLCIRPAIRGLHLHE
jgi:hypothetical protein